MNQLINSRQMDKHFVAPGCFGFQRQSREFIEIRISEERSNSTELRSEAARAVL